MGFRASNCLSASGIQPARVRLHRAEREQLLDVIGRSRAAEQEALDAVAADCAQLLELGLALDTLGDDAEIEPVPKGDDRFDQPQPAASLIALLDERPADLQHVDREPSQLRER